MSKLTNFQLGVVTFLKYSLFLIIIAVPFYAFFTTWIGSNTGGLLFLRAWKELLLLLMVLGSAYLLSTEKSLRRRFFSDRLTWVVAVYGIWTLVSGIFLVTDLDAAALGIAIQFRSFIVFLIAALAVFFHKVTEDTLYKLITIPGFGVVAFGLLQMFVLPHDFLKHFGYQKNVTIAPFFTIDEQINRIRIFSTLRGPNPLGVYLLAPILLLVNKIKSTKRVARYILYVMPFLIVLYGSQSRSAWLALLAAIGVYTWLVVSKKWKLVLITASFLLALIGGVGIYHYRYTNFVQDIVLHDNPEEGGEVSSNEGRIDAFNEAKADIVSSPVWGCGVGCAGPASFHNKNGVKISENFYIQTIQELGIVGLIVMVVLQLIVAVRLYKRKTNFAYAWLAVFIGVSVASLLSHAWADDTIAYIWWAVAGLLVGLSNGYKKTKYEQI